MHALCCLKPRRTGVVALPALLFVATLAATSMAPLATAGAVGPPPGGKRALAEPAPAAPIANADADAQAVSQPDPCEQSTAALAAQAAHDAAEAARAAAEAAHATAQAVHDLAGHVEDLEHTEPSVAPTVPTWGYKLALNALTKAGNASNFNGQASLEVHGHWRQWRTDFALRGAGGFSDSVNDTKDVQRQVTTLNGLFSVRGERYYTPFLSNYALVELSSDLVASIEFRSSGELGITLTWFEVMRDDFTKSRLRTSVGIEGMRESRRQFFPTRAVPDVHHVLWVYGPPVTFDFRYSLSRNVYAQENLKVLYDIRDINDWRVTNDIALAAAITDHVGLQVTYEVRYIGTPAANRRTTDHELSAGLNFTF